MKSNRGIKDTVGWSAEFALLLVVEVANGDSEPCLGTGIDFARISRGLLGHGGTGRVGFGGIPDFVPEAAADSRTGTDGADDEDPADVTPKGAPNVKGLEL